MSRREQWKEDSWRISPIVLEGDESDPLLEAWNERQSDPLRPRESEGFNSFELTRMSKELIFYNEDDGSPAFAYVIFALDLGTAELVVTEVLSAINLDHDDVLTTLAIAYTNEVPVVPDTDALAPQLEALERELFAQGFTHNSGEKSERRLVVTRYADVDVDSVDVLEAIERTKPITPSEARVVLGTLRRELSELNEAKRTLEALRSAIEELARLLGDDQTDESQLQRCLTRNPILFGPEYVQILPKFRLGGDFEMDFALERRSGLIDLVEIERASHLLFNKRGDPRKELVHAEQQVLDWLDWIERFRNVVEQDLPQMQRPVGYVVIGRDRSLDDGLRRRLSQRNAILAPAVEVMTFDGLLERAQALMRSFEGLSSNAQGNASQSSTP